MNNIWANNRHGNMAHVRQNEDLGNPGQNEDFGKYCRTIQDFPKKGVVFKDITTLLQNGGVYRQAIHALADQFSGKIDVVVCIEARGFLIGSPMAYELGVGIVPVRKIGKLPSKTHKIEYALEYGTDSLEIHQDAIKPEQRVLIVDDVLATGGTCKAVIDLIRKMEGEVIGCSFLIEIESLKGRAKLDIPINSLIKC
jgi:adenine phosphoribosyltransferase